MRVVRQVNQDVKKRLDRAIKGFDHLKLGVGWFENSRYQNGTPVAYVASVQEFGDSKIPPRLGMRATAKKEQPRWRDLAHSAAKAILAGNETAKSALEKMGVGIEGDMAKHITEVHTPKLADSTIAARVRKMADGKTIGSLDKPLIESGLMFDSLTSKVGREV